MNVIVKNIYVLNICGDDIYFFSFFYDCSINVKSKF